MGEFALAQALLSTDTGHLDGQFDKDPFLLVRFPDSWIPELFVQIVTKPSDAFHVMIPLRSLLPVFHQTFLIQVFRHQRGYTIFSVLSTLLQIEQVEIRL